MDILEIVPVLIRDAAVIRDDDTAVEFRPVELLGKGADNISKAAGLDKRYTFRCYKEYILHTLSSIYAWAENRFSCPDSLYLINTIQL